MPFTFTNTPDYLRTQELHVIIKLHWQQDKVEQRVFFSAVSYFDYQTKSRNPAVNTEIPAVYDP